MSMGKNMSRDWTPEERARIEKGCRELARAIVETLKQCRPGDRPVDVGITCGECGARRVFASGYNALFFGDDRLEACAAQAGWSLRPPLCPACAEAENERRTE